MVTIPTVLNQVQQSDHAPGQDRRALGLTSCLARPL